MGDGGHVNTASSNVGRHQNLHMTFAQRHQATVAQALIQGTVQGHSAETVLLQVIGQAVTLNLSAGKHDGLINGGITQPVVQQLAFVLRGIGPEQDLLDVLVLFLRCINLNPLWFAHHACCQLLNAGGQRGTEHHGLLALDGELVHFSQVIGKAEVQHAVSFVNHKELNLVQFELHGALEVKQTTRRSHHQIGVLQLGNLQLVRHAANDIGNTQATAMANQVNRIMRDLLGQFTGWAQNQRAGFSRLEIAGAGRVLALGPFWRSLAFGCCISNRLFKIGTLFGLGFFFLHQQRVQNRQ